MDVSCSLYWKKDLGDRPGPFPVLQRAARVLGGSSLVRSELAAYGSWLLACLTCSCTAPQSASMETMSSVISLRGLLTFLPPKLSCKLEGGHKQHACLTPT